MTITATSEGQSGSSAISVTAPVATVGVTPTPSSLTVGQTVQLTATPRDAGGNALTGRVVTWGSSSTNVATVNGNGLVTGVAAGSVTITATSEGRSGTAAVSVTPTPVASVSREPSGPQRWRRADGSAHGHAAQREWGPADGSSGDMDEWEHGYRDGGGQWPRDRRGGGIGDDHRDERGHRRQCVGHGHRCASSAASAYRRDVAERAGRLDDGHGLRVQRRDSDERGRCDQWRLAGREWRRAHYPDHRWDRACQPVHVARIFYPQGFGAGSEPGTLYYPQGGTKDHYVGYEFKLSNPYSNHSVGTKQWYPYSATAELLHAVRE